MLASEGIAVNEMAFEMFNTWVLEDEGIIKGFFTVRIWNCLPTLQHMIIDKKFRTFKLCKAMMDEFKKVVKQTGKYCFILFPKEKPYLKKIANHFFHNTQVNDYEGNTVLLAEV